MNDEKLAEVNNQPLLPKLVENPRLSFPEAGAWDGRKQSILDDLIVSLDVERNDFAFVVNAIPDVWARPLLFEMALYDDKHLLHKRILGEWRGLLAMLALRESRGIALSVKPVVIPGSNQSRDGNKRLSKFESALAKLIPTRTLTSDTTWNRLYVFFFGDKPIGMTSPTTLVCTAADYYDRIHGVSWCDGRFLYDPASELNDLEKMDLAGWLVTLNKALADQSEVEHLEDLVRLINEFIDDLVGKEAKRDKLTCKISSASFDMKVGLFQLLNHPIQGVIDPFNSNVRLVPSAGKKPGITLLVVDPNLADDWGVPEQEINIIGTTTMASFPFSGLGSIYQGNQFGTIILPEDIRWCSPQYFFTDKFFVIAQPDALPGAASGIKGANNLKFQDVLITPILPLNYEIINYLDRDDLCQRVSLENTPEGFKVKLRLPLSGVGGEQRDFEITREYRTEKGEILRLDNLPVLEIWPNFNVPHWRAYFMYFDTANQNTFYARPAAPTETMVAKSFLNSRGEILREITRSESFPEALICESKVGNNRLTAGIILLKQPQSTASATESWKVGIDFGTSGTNVFAGAEGIEPAQVAFPDRLVQVTEPGAVRANLYEYFIQDDPNRTTSFLSIFHDFQNQAEGQSLLDPLLNGHIYFLRDIDKFRSRAPGMMVDLKWGLSEERLRARAFLEQLCLQCSVEAVFKGAKEISWRFSFPTAFSIRDKNDFIVIWDSICKRCNEQTGLKSKEHPRNMSESVATAHFFANFEDIKAKLSRGAVCIDIGGGTSDISIWQGTDLSLKLQTSLLYAGRDIFLELLRRKPDFLEKFKIVEKDIIEYFKVIKGDPKAFYAQADAIISQKGAKMLEQLPILGAEPIVRDFVNLLSLGLAGLFYYVGLILNDLFKQGKYQLRMPNIFIGGNGSQIFKWVAGGEYNINSPINSLFKDILNKTTSFNSEERFEIQLSPRPKAEVAYGLVKSDLIKMNYNDDASIQGVIAGENFRIKDEAAASSLTTLKPKKKKSKAATEVEEDGTLLYPWQTILSKDMVLRSMDIPKELPQLKNFLDIVNQSAEKTGLSAIPYDNQLFIDVSDDLNQKLSQWQIANKGKEEAMKIEPLFIRALKILLEMKADEWAKKY